MNGQQVIDAWVRFGWQLITPSGVALVAIVVFIIWFLAWSFRGQS